MAILIHSLNCQHSLQRNNEGRGDVQRALKPLRITFRLYTSEATGAQNYYCLKANDFDAMIVFSGTVSEVCADL